MLNRILRWVRPPYGKGQERIELEPDPRHAEILMQQCGLDGNSNSVTTRGIKRVLATAEEPVDPTDRTVYRSRVMRLCYLAADRIDIQFAAKELARSMQNPTASDSEAVKRCVRYLVRHPGLVQRFVRQVEIPNRLVCWSDTDHAGCLLTRKSSTSVKVFHGRNMLKSTSTMQAVIALSSGGSDFYGAVKATARGLGLVSMMKDLGVVFSGSERKANQRFIA